MSPRRLLVLAGLVVACAVVNAHVRLIHPSNGSPLWWQSPGAVSIVINDAGSDDLADGSHVTALRNAIDAWNDIDGASIRLVEDASPAAMARTDWGSSGVHLIWFDEHNSSGYFPNGSSTVAITPVWFYSNGRIADADVLFNGKGFGFTTSRQPGRYDVQDVAAHELGHLVGLDHSGWAGASMYPYVDPSVILHRSLSEDERHGMRAIYPSASHASISGTVRRSSDDSPVAGAHVVVRDAAGRTAAAGLSGGDGAFSIRGLEAGTYTLYANPLDFPVSSANLGAGRTVETDFESTLHGPVVVTGGVDNAVGDVSVGGDVFLSLGRNTDNYPLRVEAGRRTNLVVRGAGLNSGSTLTCSDPTIGVTVTGWFTSQVSAQVSVPANAAPGHADLMVVDGFGRRSILTAGLEITPPDPTVTLASPNQGDIAGGTAVTISGADFNAGARVVMGGEVYVDGEPGGCVVVNPTTITLTTRTSAVGLTDVVVVDASGVEGRRLNGFQFLATPTIQTAFPPVGTVAGGTELHITGSRFDLASVVRIDGVTQGSVFPASEELLVVLTEPGVAGGPYTLEVENPGGAIATSQFTYVAQADPAVTLLSPDEAPSTGGEVVTISGANFGPDVEVLFGVDPSTGQGGTPAAQVVRLDANTLEVVTPALAAGATPVMLLDAGTGQADVLTSGFTVNAVASGGGGGGCHAVPVQGPPDPRDALRGCAFFALLALGVRLLRRAPGAAAG